jgi:glycosyltransferase involved in cell wall biosynthesis
MISWPNHLLRPVIITYNRAGALRRTLELFYNAGLTSMELTVLDNASPDNTGEVVADFQQRWPSLQYQRNSYNIGGCANYLRGVEITGSEYCWIIGDDDDWFFDALDELVAVLAEGSADIIRLGWQVESEERGQLLSMTELARTSPQFFGSVGMISSVIVRRSFVLPYFSECYFSLSDFYPQIVPFYREALSSAVMVYSLSRDFMTHTPSDKPGYFYGDLEWLSYYCRNTRYLADRQLQQQVVAGVMAYLQEQFRFRYSLLARTRIILQLALKPKALGFDQFPYFCSLLGYGHGMRGAVLLALAIYSLLPVSLLRRLTSLLREKKGLDGDLDKELQLILQGRKDRP